MKINKSIYDKASKALATGVPPGEVYNLVGLVGPISTREITDALNLLCIKHPDRFPEDRVVPPEYYKAEIVEMTPIDQVCNFLQRLKSLPPILVSTLACDIAYLFGPDTTLLQEAVQKVDGVSYIQKRNPARQGPSVGGEATLGYDIIGKELKVEVVIPKLTVKRSKVKPSPASVTYKLGDMVLAYLKEVGSPKAAKDIAEALEVPRHRINSTTLDLANEKKIFSLYKEGGVGKHHTLVLNGVPEGYRAEPKGSTRGFSHRRKQRHFAVVENVVMDTELCTIYSSGVVLLKKRRYSVLELKQICVDADVNGVKSIEIQGAK